MTVAGTNDGPVVTDQGFTTDEDTSVIITEAELLAGASDLDGDALSVIAVEGSTNGEVVDNGDGTWTFTPDADFNGEAGFTFTVADENGGETSADATIEVAAVNDGPVAEDGTLDAAEDGAAVAGNLSANDIDGLGKDSKLDTPVDR